MAWEKPKINWGAGDLVSSGDLNRIEKNISHIGAIQFTGNTTVKIDTLHTESIIQLNTVRLFANSRLVLKRAQYYINELYNIDKLILECSQYTIGGSSLSIVGSVTWDLSPIFSGSLLNDLSPDAVLATNSTGSENICILRLKTGTGSGGSIEHGSSWQFGLSVESIPA